MVGVCCFVDGGWLLVILGCVGSLRKGGREGGRERVLEKRRVWE